MMRVHDATALLRRAWRVYSFGAARQRTDCDRPGLRSRRVAHVAGCTPLSTRAYRAAAHLRVHACLSTAQAAIADLECVVYVLPMLLGVHRRPRAPGRLLPIAIASLQAEIDGALNTARPSHSCGCTIHARNPCHTLQLSRDLAGLMMGPRHRQIHEGWWPCGEAHSRRMIVHERVRSVALPAASVHKRARAAVCGPFLIFLCIRFSPHLPSVTGLPSGADSGKVRSRARCLAQQHV